MIFFGEDSLRNEIREFVAHYQLKEFLFRAGRIFLISCPSVRLELGEVDFAAPREVLAARSCRSSLCDASSSLGTILSQFQGSALHLPEHPV